MVIKGLKNTLPYIFIFGALIESWLALRAVAFQTSSTAASRHLASSALEPSVRNLASSLIKLINLFTEKP